MKTSQNYDYQANNVTQNNLYGKKITKHKKIEIYYKKVTGNTILWLQTVFLLAGLTLLFNNFLALWHLLMTSMKSSSIPQRYVVAILCFFGLFNAFTMRTCLSIAITEMVKKSPTEETVIDDNTCTYEMTVVPENSSTFGVGIASRQNTNKGVYEWTEYTQGLILSSFYWGYLFTHVPGGLIAEKYGGKHTFGLGILITAISTILTPMAVYTGGSNALIILRVIMGLGEGVTMPASNVLLAKWAPPPEKSRMVSFVFASGMIGAVFATVVSGWILQYSSMGWPLVFYTMGAIGVVWYLCWLILCYSSPQNHPFITQEEANYLKECIDELKQGDSSVPWRHILSSRAIYAVIAGFFGFCWLNLSMVTDLSKYMSGVLKYSVEYNGYFTSLIFLCTWIGANTTPWLADYLISKKNISTTLVRKIFSFVALPLSAAFVVGASYAGCNRGLVIAMFAISMTLKGAAYPSILTNPLDLGPNYAGTVMALTNGLGASTGIFGPYVIGVFTTNQTLSEWRLVFWIMFVIVSLFNLIFLVCGSGQEQYWNNPAMMYTKNDKKDGRQTGTENSPSLDVAYG